MSPSSASKGKIESWLRFTSISPSSPGRDEDKVGPVSSLGSPALAVGETGTDMEKGTETPTGGDEQEQKQLEKWNDPPENKYRYLVVNFAFIILGMNDAAIGALLPYMETYYDVSYTIVSLVFLAPWGGYLVAAMCNNKVHHHFGQRGVALLGPLVQILGYIALSLHPPFAALPPLLLLPGFGSGLQDSAWNAWVGNMQSANELLGFIHGCYGLGATIGPLIATAFVTKGMFPWYYFYYVMLGMAVVELILMLKTFWPQTGAVYRAANKQDDGRTTTRTVMRQQIPWIVAFFLLGYVGAEVSLGGWIVTFMLNVRGAAPFEAGLTVTFFWLGLTIGRVTLGLVTGRIGEKLAISIYLSLCIALQLLYWLIPNFIASAIFVAFDGVFLGPLFPAAIVALTKLLPSDHHVSAIGFAAAFGGGGAAVFPFAIGAIAQSQGVWVLQPVIVAILASLLLIWLVLPGGLKPGGLERARDAKEKPGHRLWAFFLRIRQSFKR
ncbi:tRNA wybutosine-synthesizing protein [Xylariaceae sp. FL0255]|nr:tRNA wybutosine-synthesizing protein [Xylariaceae sp. FL0255]